ncbi:MAG: hypothetical protein QM813_13960 [Verrucomicrobiota bacterium]
MKGLPMDVRNSGNLKQGMKAFLQKIIPVILVAISWRATAVTRYVDLNSPEPTPPYTNWSTAATLIQDAVDAAKPGDEILVTNGVYQSGGAYAGGLLKSRLAITKPITVRSVHGAGATSIKGYQVPTLVNDDDAIRGVFLANGATLSGFKILNGATRSSGLFPTNSDYVGGGVFSCVCRCCGDELYRDRQRGLECRRWSVWWFSKEQVLSKTISLVMWEAVLAAAV